MKLQKFLGSVESFLTNAGRDTDKELSTLSRHLSGTGEQAPEPSPATEAPYKVDARMAEVMAGKAEASRRLQELPYGAFEVDKGGTVLRYNNCEESITGIKHDCVGLNLFTEIAPCTRRPDFLGRFMDGVEQGNLNALFQYTFTFQGASTKVWVCMKTDPRNPNSHWVFFKRM